MPLHIFEPRYRRMVGDAARTGSELGIVAAQGQTIEVVGCTAAVEEVTRRYDDGRFDVRIRGVRRFRTAGLDQNEECLQAAVELFDDRPEPPCSPEEVESLYTLTLEAAAMAGGRIAAAPDLADPHPSFRAADLLPLELNFRQQLLTLRSERERAAKLTGYLNAWMKNRRITAHAKAISSTNGKAHG